MKAKSDAEPTYAKNKAELCRLIACSRVSLDAWLKLPESPKPMSNGKFKVAEWRAFRAARAVDPKFDESQELKLIKQRNEAAQSTIDLMKSAEEAIPVAWCEQLFAHLALSVCSIIQGSDIAEHDKIALTEQIEKIDAHEYLSQIRSQTIDIVGEDAGVNLANGAGEG
jgi:hypothetical protein